MPAFPEAQFGLCCPVQGAMSDFLIPEDIETALFEGEFRQEQRSSVHPFRDGRNLVPSVLSGELR